MMCVSFPLARAFTGLVLLILPTLGLGSMCDAAQKATCYGALGGPVYLQLMGNTRGLDLQVSYEGGVIFRFRRSKPVFYNGFNNSSRWQFVPDNGTMIINAAERRDSGTYRVEIHNESSGTSVGVHTVQLIIKAPVSKVDLSVNCSAYGERRAVCSSNGDSPQFSWYLNGRHLTETSTNQDTRKQAKADLTKSTDADSKKETPPLNTAEDSHPAHSASGSPEESKSVILTLPEGTEGNLTCSATNHISTASNTQLLPSCTTTTALPTTPTTSTSVSTASMTTSIVVSIATNQKGATTAQSTWPDNKYYLGAAVLGGVLFLCVSIAVFCTWKKKKNTDDQSQDVVYSQCKKKTFSPPDDQSQDVVYSQCKKKTSSPPADSYELEYAEVSILKRGKSERRKREDERVEYGDVRRREETVEYGEVKMPGSANHTAPEGPAPTSHTPPQESVYAQVLKGQR